PDRAASAIPARDHRARTTSSTARHASSPGGHGPPTGSTLSPSVSRKGSCRFSFQVEVGLFAHVDGNAQDRATGERARGLVLRADVVTAVESDTQPVAT